MKTLADAIAYFKGEQERAEQEWTYREVLAHTIPHLEDMLRAGSSQEEAENSVRCLEYCLHLAQACHERDPSVGGLASSLERLVQTIQGTLNLKAEAVEDAFETVLLEVKYCISSRKQ